MPTIHPRRRAWRALWIVLATLLGTSLVVAPASAGKPPSLDIEKFTNGWQADNPNDPDVPVLAPGDPVTWTYRVTNGTDTPIAGSDLTVTDYDVEVTPVLDPASDAGGDGILSPGETWVYRATGTAKHLAVSPGPSKVVAGCDTDFSGDPRPTYQNKAKAAAGDLSDWDYSHYCNPPGINPGIDIEKTTNGGAADGPNWNDVPRIAPGDPVTWRYRVVNTGDVAFTADQVVVVDDRGVDPVLLPWSDAGSDGILSPGERWIFQARGVAANLKKAMGTVPGCDDDRPTYRNTGIVVATTDDGDSVSDTDRSHYCNPTPPPANPGIDIEKTTNGFGADRPDSSNVPEIAPGDPVTWRYKVLNTGDVPFPRTAVTVTDDQGVVPVFQSWSDDGRDGILSPGEEWVYVARGTADVLSFGDPGIVEGCRDDRPTYENIGTVVATSTAGDVSDEDPSHYCNPTPPPGDPGVDIEKTTNGAAADGPNWADVPEIAPGDRVTWIYTVDNTGDVPFAEADVVVTDDRGVVPTLRRWSDDGGDGILSPGERWVFRAVGTARVLAASDADTVAGCGDGRPTYENTGAVVATTATGQRVDDSDPSHYCNPPLDAAIGDRVWFDTDQDGVQDDGEPGVEGVTVELLDDSGTVVATTTTDADGLYLFSGLTPGDYQVRFVLGDGQAFTVPDAGGDDATDSDADPATGAAPITTLAPGETDLSFDAGIVVPAAIDIEKYTLIPPAAGGADICDTYERPRQLTLTYTGANGTNSQGDKGSVTGDPAGADPVRIKVFRDSSKVYFDATVGLGDTFDVSSSTVGDSEFASNTYAEIRSASGALLSTIGIHTSCSAPLILGESFGSLRFDGFVDKNGAGETLPDQGLGEDADVPTGPEGSVGGVVVWNYVVTNPGSVGLTAVAVSDDAGTPGDTGDDFSAEPVLDGAVNVGDADGDGVLDPGEAWRFTADGIIVEGQYANLGTAVGQPATADGTPIGVPVRATDPSHHLGVLTSGDLCETLEKPAKLTFTYTGDGPEATSHAQDPSKVTVTGDPADAPRVHVKAFKDSKVWFEGFVDLGGTFTLDVANAGTDKFDSETFIQISTPEASPGDRTLLQSIRFHTSCSQPLQLGDRFGAARLVGYVDKNGVSA